MDEQEQDLVKALRKAEDEFAAIEWELEQAHGVLSQADYIALWRELEGARERCAMAKLAVASYRTSPQS
jgi:hypothetical protein